MVIFIKTIGIILRNFSENNKNFIGVREELINTFYKYDVNIIGIPIGNDFNKTKELVKICNGVILSGGDYFLEQDFLLINYLYEENIPVLGICLGMQGIAKAFSNKNEININNHLSDEMYVHYININKDSLLYKIVGRECILVNSRHKSAIIDTHINVSALSDDGVIEAVEDKSKKFFLGLQWHPESLNDENSKKIFDYFINII